MIHWNYAIPRLLLATFALLLVYLGLNPLVRWGLESFGEQVLSTRVEIGELDLSLQSTELRIERLAVADPGNLQRNLVEARQMKLALETGPLLMRKFVVKDGMVRGLRFRVERQAAAEPVDHWQLDIDGKRAEQLAERWLETLALSMREKVEEEINALESVRLARELLERWPAEYQQLEAKVRGVKVRIEAVRNLFQTPPQNLAAGLQHYQATLSELQRLQSDLGALGEQLDALPNKAVADRDAILAAKDRDIRALEQRFEAIRLDEEALTMYLLGPEMGKRVIEVADWVRWVRAHLPSEEDDPENRLLGVDVLFTGKHERPDFLIESLLVDGETEIAGRPYSFVATMAGVTTDPKLYGRPAVIRAELAGETTVEIRAVLDRTGDAPVDQLVLNCPDIKLPSARLGREGALSLQLAPGKTHLWVGLTLSGDQLAGSMLIKQSGVVLAPALPDSLGGKRLADSLAAAAESLKEIEVQVDLSGELLRPRWQIRSSLGPKLAEGLNRAALAEIEYRRNQAAELVQKRVEQELANFQSRLLADEEILKSRLRLNEAEIQQLATLVSQRIPSAEQIFSKALGGKTLPLRF